MSQKRRNSRAQRGLNWQPITAIALALLTTIALGRLASASRALAKTPPTAALILPAGR
jgi:hypothetical protein